jgi:acyl-CoA synthetase (NDP forming)
LLNFAHAAPLYMDPAARYEAGRVGLVAQSGSIGTSLINNPRGVRWSHAVSSGNEAVVTTGDILGYYVDCPQVDVVCAFVETIRAPDLFFEHCDRAWELGKPVIACATGRTQEAQAAAVAHSGALAVPSRMVDAALERHGVIRVESLEEMLETAIAMEAPRRPRGRGVAVLTASGGQIELYHDHVPRESLNTPPLSSDIQQELRGLLADFLATNNPLDWWGDADWEARLPKIVDCVARDPAIDIVLQVGDFTAWPTGDGMRATIALDGIRPVAANRPDVLFVVLDTIGGSPSAHDVESARAEDVLVLSGYKDGLRALGHLVDYHLRDVHRPASPRAVEAGPIDLDGEPLEILARAGFDVARSITLDEQTSLDDVVVQLGRPVVAKIGDGDVLHKTELGGVILGIDSADELDDAVARLRARGAQTVVVQEQILDGVELLLGLQSATELGTFVVVGLGGIWTEVLDDVQVGFVGLTREDATAMLARLRGYPLLTGARGTPPVAADALVDAVLRLDSLGAVLGEAVQSLDINPLIVTADRAVAVDAIVVWR